MTDYTKVNLMLIGLSNKVMEKIFSKTPKHYWDDEVN